MAITKTIVSDSGLTTLNAYIRVRTYNGTKENFVFILDIYKDQQSYQEGFKTITASKEYSFNPDNSGNSTNYIKQAYLFLKTLPEFISAEDC